MWVECSRKEYLESFEHKRGTSCCATKDELVWRYWHGELIAKSSKGYIPKNEEEKFYKWT